MQPYKGLNQYMEKGCVFHGSIHDGITVLEPSKPDDAGSDLWNKDTAVYAARSPVYAVIFALRKGYKGTFTVNTDANGQATASFGKLFQRIIEQNQGFVYVLDGKAFVDSNGFQCKSFRTVEPVDIIQVTLSDYTALGGLIEYL